MRVLVTGFGGYLGPVIVRHLKAAGHYVIGLDTGWFLGDYASLPVWPDEAIFADIRDIMTLGFTDANVIVHLAGLSNDPMGELDPLLTEEINFHGTLGLLGLPGRQVIVSSCSVYGATDEIVGEDSPVNPLTTYARCKAWVDEWAAIVNDNTISLRLGTVYGYSPGHRLDLVVNRMVYDVLNKGYATVTGDSWRPLTHIEDVARAVTWAVESDATGIYNVVGENMRMRDLGRLVTGYAHSELLEGEWADRRDYRASGSKLHEEGFIYRHSVEGSLPVLFEKTSTLPPGDYTRINTLKRLMERGDLSPSLSRAA